MITERRGKLSHFTQQILPSADNKSLIMSARPFFSGPRATAQRLTDKNDADESGELAVGRAERIRADILPIFWLPRWSVI